MESKKVVPSCCAKLILISTDWSFFDELWLWTSTQRSPEGHVVAICRNFSWPPSYLTESSSSQFGDGFYTIQAINLYRFISRISGQIGDWCFFCFLHSIGSSTSCCHRFHFTRFHRVFTEFSPYSWWLNARVFVKITTPGTWKIQLSLGFFDPNE